MADKTIQQINTDNNLPNPSGNEVVPAFDPDAPSSTVGIVISALPISTATQTALDAKQASLVSGTNIKTINSTSLLGSGNIALGGAVDSVNTQTGVVVIDADDISDTSTTNKYVTSSDVTNLSNLSGTNSGDQDISGIATNASAITDIETKTDNISVTQAVNLDTMESNIATNNSKTTNATHTGEVTGSGALTIAGDVVDEANLKVSNDPTNGYSLVARSGNTGGMTWEDISGGGGGTVDVLSNVATDKIIGRTTAGSGDSEELSPSATRTLLNVEDGATADQTGAQIKSAYEAESNAYTDTKNTKLSGIEALADVTDATNVAAAGAAIPTGTPDGTKFLRDDSVWTAIPGGGDALTANPLSQFAATTSAQLAGVLSDETGTGALVFATSPTLVTPALGTPASGVATNLTGTAAGLTVGATTGVEAGADVTDATNVTAAGALMDSEVTNLAQVKAFDSTDYAAALGTDDNYVTDAEKTVVGNTSGTNTGDQTSVTGNAGTVTTNANLTGVVTSTGNATAIANSAITNAMLANGAVANLTGTNTGDNATNSQYSGLVSNATHTGDVTGATALTIANNAVTNAKSAQMATKTYKGRTTAGTGNSEDVAVATLKTDLVLVKGDVGLGNVDNTTDAGKPVSTAQQTALDDKVDGTVRITVADSAPSSPADGDLWVDTDETDTTISDLVDAAVAAKNLVDYPVGTLYINRTSSSNPNTFLTGMGSTTWVRIQDKMIMARGSTYTSDAGAATHTHPLSSDGAALIYIGSSGTIIREVSAPSGEWGAGTNTISSGSKSTNTTTTYNKGAPLDGDTDAGDNIPPMVVAYVWERTV